MSYNLEWRDTATLTTTTVTGITDLFYDLTGLTAETDYEFRVQEDDDTDTSAFSAWSGFTTATGGTSFIEALAPNTATTSIQTLDDVTGASINFGALSASANSVALNTVSGHSDTLALISSQSFPVPLDLQAGQFVSVSAEASTANVVQIGARSGYLVNAAPAESATGTLTLTERAGQVIAIEPGLASAIGTNLQQITGAIIGSFRRSSIIDMSTRYSTIDQTTSFTIEEV